MENDELKNLKEKVLNPNRLFLARVPEKTKKEFIEFANGEFAEDYGMCLHYVWNAFKHYQQIINTQDTKLDYMIELIKNMKPAQSMESKTFPKMLSTEKEVKEE